MVAPIAFFTGSADSFNVRQDTAAIGETLSSSFQLDLVTTQSPPNSVRERYSVYGTDQSNTLRGEASALHSYLATNAPMCVMNVTQPPVHGNIVAALARRHGVPFVYRYSGDRFYVHRLADGWRQRAKWFILNNVVGRIPLWFGTRHVALGPVGKRRLADRGVDERKVTVLPSPVRPERYSIAGQKADLDIPAGRKVVLFVGRRSRLKGLETLESAIPAILDRRTDIQFVFLGRGRDVSAAPSATDHVTVVGSVPPSTMPKYYRRADLLVHPSWTESFGRVLVEALLCGTPVVAREAGDMPLITSNTFESTEQLVDLVVGLESVSLEDGTRFTPAILQSEYEAFFEQFQSTGFGQSVN